MENYDVVILGSGPGGYVTAIRSSQLGFKTAIIEKESLGGICLNWGCIPTKALLKSAEVFEYLNHAESYGIEVENFSKNFEKVIKRSRDVANTMSKGVNFLMKKNKIKVYTGFGKINSDKTISIKGEKEESRISGTIPATAYFFNLNLMFSLIKFGKKSPVLGFILIKTFPY